MPNTTPEPQLRLHPLPTSMTTETTHGAFSTRSASGRVLEPERESFRLRDPLPDLAILATLLAWVAMLFG